jgi:hypothetical protein
VISERRDTKRFTVCGFELGEKPTALRESLPGLPGRGISTDAGSRDSVLCLLPPTQSCTESIFTDPGASATEKIILPEHMKLALSAGERTSISLFAGSVEVSVGESLITLSFLLSVEPEHEITETRMSKKIIEYTVSLFICQILLFPK